MKLQSEERSRARTAVVAVTLAYLWWGVSPLYFKLLVNIDAREIIAHRIVWTLLLLGLIKYLGFAPRVYWSHISNPKRALPFLFSGAFILSNWFIFTWAVIHGYVLETSLGYFINPLFNVLLGVILLGERLRPLQSLAVLLAAGGVCFMIWQHGALPLVALFCAVTFSLYSLFRKQAKIDSINGLALELSFGLPIGLGYFLWIASQQTLHFGIINPLDSILLLIVGPVTMVPLLLFGFGAPKINLTTVGILQYMSPTLSFFLAVFVFMEPFDAAQLTAFLCIWIGLALYTWDAWSRARTSRTPEILVPPE